MKEQLQRIRKSVVFLGTWETRIENGKQITEPNFIGTGFLVLIKNIYHLITAKHVIYDMDNDKLEDDSLNVFFNFKNGTLGSRSVEEIKTKLNATWIFHDKKYVDVAILPFMYAHSTEDCTFIDENDSVKIESLHELIDVFFLSYQPGLETHNKIVPIFRNGIISLIDDDGTFHIDGSAFEGNSGSPVFTQWMPLGQMLGGESKLLCRKFIGIIGSYVPYDGNVLSHKRVPTGLIFEENTGLSEVWSVNYIEEIKNLKSFQEQLARIISAHGNQQSVG